MLPLHHLLTLTPNRVSAAVIRLQELIWQDIRPLKVEATAASADFVTLKVAKKLPRSKISAGAAWGKLFDQRWYRLEAPKSAQPLHLNWQDQAEATLYIDGVPYFGFDVAHRYCRLPVGARELWIESTCVQSGIWHPEATGLSQYGSRFDGAFVCHRDEETWQAYHDLKCLFDIMLDQRQRENPLLAPGLNAFGQQATLEKVSPFYRRLLRLLDEAVDAFDRTGVKALRTKLAAAYKELRQDKSFQHCVLTGHAHIDLVWLWPERIGEAKAVHVFSTVNRLLEEYPEFKFGYSQPASYEAVQRRAPELYRKVQQRIKQGKWQATGAMYVESDTLIAHGEALARSFVLGQEGFSQVNGKPSRLTWLPDVFGYSASLPQLMKLSGVDYFFTTKMTWNAVNRFPYSSFIWRGVDGSEVLSHVMQESNYVTHMNIGDIKNAMYGHQQADVHNEFLLPTGYGDGGGGPTDEMIERARRLGSLPGMPSMAWDQPEAFFERLDKVRNKLPVHQGECYLEYHRGTYTTHGNVKEAFRNLERVLQIREAAAVAAGEGSVPVAAWKRLVFAQFHDYIPGSSIPEVYAEALPELNWLAKEQVAATQTLLGKKSGRVEQCVFNPLPVPVSGWVDLPGKREAVLVELPPLAGLPLEQAAVKVEPQQAKAAGRVLSNGLVELKLNAAGAVEKLVIRGKETAMREPLGMLALYPDHPANFEPWDIDRQALSLGELCKTPAKISAGNKGHWATLTVSRKIGKQSKADIVYRLEAGATVVKMEIHLDWQEPEHLLKLNLPTGYAAANARFGIPYGSILRSQIPNSMVSEAMWEVPFSRWLAVFDEGERDGLFVVTESKYGATVRNGEIGLSLVRSPRMTGFDSHRHVRKPELARLKPSSIYSDMGKHVIKLAIGHYDSNALLAQQPAVLADTLFTPPLAYQGDPLQSVFEGLDSNGTLMPTWVMPAGKNSWVLRLNETLGRRGKATVRLKKGWKAVAVDLLGNPVDKKIIHGVFSYSPYEIISLKISSAAV